jgi:uncharacterized protein YecT (DUF1311 family)
LQTKITANQNKRLINAQLAWMKFRDAACEFEAGQFEGVFASSREFLKN